MSKGTVLTAIALVSIGIIFGAVLVTGIGGSGLSFADPSVTFNTERLYTPSAGVEDLNAAFQNVASIVTPQVVYVEVKAKVKSEGRQMPFDFFHPRQEGQEPEERIQRGSGSGIILTDDGYILTNRHVIANATEEGITVTLHDTRKFDAVLVGEDENTDIAVIKINASGLSTASLGNSDKVQVGEWVLAVGNPLGFTSTVTTGIVSAISRNIGIMGGGYGIESFIQTDAVINPGNSGGALVNLSGQVIGINTAIATSGFSQRYIGYGFAVPVNLAKVVADALIKHGSFERGYIGIQIEDIDAEKASALGLDRYTGVLVGKVNENSAGEAAGLQAGDAIVEVDGKAVESSNQLQARVGTHHPGDVITLKVWRGNEYITKKVTLKGRDGEEAMSITEKKKDTPKEESSKPLEFDKAGFTVKGLSAKQRKDYDVEGGVLISEVDQNGKAFESRLRPGFVVFEAIRSGTKIPITSVKDFERFADALDDGESILLRVKDSQGNTVFAALKAPLK